MIEIKENDFISYQCFGKVLNPKFTDSKGNISTKVQLDNGTIVNITHQLAEEQFKSCSHFNEEEVIKLNATDLAHKFIESKNLPFTVEFHKLPNAKDITTSLISNISEKFDSETLTDVSIRDLRKLLENNLKNVLKGEKRKLIGYHENEKTVQGRIRVIDLEIEKDPSKDYDNRARQVDPRNIISLIVNNKKYVKK